MLYFKFAHREGHVTGMNIGRDCNQKGKRNYQRNDLLGCPFVNQYLRCLTKKQ